MADSSNNGNLWAGFEFLPRSMVSSWSRWQYGAAGPYVALVALGILRDIAGLITGLKPVMPNAPALADSQAVFCVQSFREMSWALCALTDFQMLYLTAMLLLVGMLVISWWRSIPDVFEHLRTSGRLVAPEDPEKSETAYRAFVGDYVDRLRSRKRFIVIGFAVLLAVVSIVGRVAGDKPPDFSGLDTLQQQTVAQIGNTLWVATVYGVGPILWAFFVGLAAWLILVTARTIRALTTRFDFNLQPDHPDGCGGLKSLGNHNLQMTLPILLMLVLLVIYATFNFAVIDQHNDTVALSALLSPAGSSEATLQRLQLETTAAYLTVILVLAPLAIATFLIPLWSIHSDMLAQKRRYEEDFAASLADSERRLRDFVKAGKLEEARQITTERELLRAFHPGEMGFPTWPFDRTIFARFLSPQILSAATLLVGISDPVSNLVAKLVEAALGGQ